MTRSDVGKGHPEYYQDMAERIAARDARRLLRQPVRQPGQSARAREHHRAGDLGADGARRRRGRVRRRLRRHDDRPQSLTSRASRPTTEMVLADPGARSWPSTCETGKIGEPRAPGWSRASARISSRRSPICRACSDAYAITDDESFATARELLATEGILGGSSLGHAARRGAALLPRADARRSASSRFVCDSGNKYLSKMFNDFWMLDQGFLERPRTAICAT